MKTRDKTRQYLRALRKVYLRATPDVIQAGENWYDDAWREVVRLAETHGVTRDVAAGVIAALSNSKEWNLNVRIADALLESVRKGERPGGHFRQCIDAALRVIRIGPFAALGGPKVAPFMRAIGGDLDAAVVDRWIWRAVNGRGTLTLKRHREVAQALRLLAAEVGKRTAQVQAIVWIVVRGKS